MAIPNRPLLLLKGNNFPILKIGLPMITRTRWGKQVQPISITSHSHASVLTNLLRAVEKATGGHGGFVYDVRLPVQWYIAVLYFAVLDLTRPKKSIHTHRKCVADCMLAPFPN